MYTDHQGHKLKLTLRIYCSIRVCLLHADVGIIIIIIILIYHFIIIIITDEILIEQLWRSDTRWIWWNADVGYTIRVSPTTSLYIDIRVLSAYRPIQGIHTAIVNSESVIVQQITARRRNTLTEYNKRYYIFMLRYTAQFYSLKKFSRYTRLYYKKSRRSGPLPTHTRTQATIVKSGNIQPAIFRQHKG